MTDKYSKEKRSEIMSLVRSRRTGPEEDVARLLRKIKLHYRRNINSLPGKPDFVLIDYRSVIFVHGCFWHGHKNCPKARLPKSNVKFWSDKVEGNRRRDSRVARLLRNKGYRVFIVWQCSLRYPERIKKRLINGFQLDL